MFIISVHFKDHAFQHDELEAISYEFKDGFLVVNETINLDEETRLNKEYNRDISKHNLTYYPISGIHRLDIREV